jgi:hypothetical protein
VADGGVTGGVAGLLGVDQRPRFHDYVMREHRSVYRLREPVIVGMVLPPKGVAFCASPGDFGIPPSYRYAVVNDEVVLVDLVTRKIVDVVKPIAFVAGVFYANTYTRYSYCSSFSLFRVNLLASCC